MSSNPAGSNARPPQDNDLLRLGEKALLFGAEACGQWWTVTGRSLQRELRQLLQGATTSTPPSELLRGLAAGYVKWLTELAAIAPAVAEKAAMELRQAAPDDPAVTGDGDAVPAVQGDYFEVGGKPFAMPARVLDASQGWAMFFVPTEAANRALGDAASIVSAFDAGGGRTPLTIVGVDYRNSDFGVYPEFVVALTVSANGDPAGQLYSYYLAIVVTQPFTQEAARVVWGLEKIIAPALQVRYAADHAQFGLSNGSGKALSIRFPRFGDGESSDQPTFSLSQRGEGANRQTCWAMTTKSGRGEGTQIGGSVTLELGVKEKGGCLCGDGTTTCLCDTLRSFDIADRLPAANGWTERQTAAFGAPRPLNLP